MQKKLWMMVLKLYFPYFAILIEGVSLGAFCSAPSIENRLVSSRNRIKDFGCVCYILVEDFILFLSH